MQVSVKKVNRTQLFAQRFPAAAKQITSYREMEAGFLFLLISFILLNINNYCSYTNERGETLSAKQACNLLAACHPEIAVVNTSQSLGQMPLLEKQSQELMCLTCLGLQIGGGCVLAVELFWLCSGLKLYSHWLLTSLRPSGKFLVTSKGRYIIGREAMILMGIPINRLKISSCSERVSYLWYVCSSLFIQFDVAPFALRGV